MPVSHEDALGNLLNSDRPKGALKRTSSDGFSTASGGVGGMMSTLSGAGPARSVAGTYVSSTASSTNTFQRRERAIWGHPTYKYQCLDPAKPFYVDPRILQVVAKNTPNQLHQISIPDGMSVHGKIHMAEKPKAALALKLEREEQRQKAEEMERQQKKRAALMALNEDLKNRSRVMSSGKSFQAGEKGAGAQETSVAPPGVVYLLPRSGDRGPGTPQADLPSKEVSTSMRPASAPVVRKVGRKYHELSESGVMDEASKLSGSAAGREEGGTAPSKGAEERPGKRAISFPLPWADKIKAAKERRALAAGAVSRTSAGPAQEAEDWETLLGRGPAAPAQDMAVGTDKEVQSQKSRARPRVDTGRRKPTKEELAAHKRRAASGLKIQEAADAPPSATGDAGAGDAGHGQRSDQLEAMPLTGDGDSSGNGRSAAAVLEGLVAPEQAEHAAGGKVRTRDYDVEYVKQWMAKKKEREKEREKEAAHERAKREERRQEALNGYKHMTVDDARKYRERLERLQQAEKQAEKERRAREGGSEEEKRARSKAKGAHPWEQAWPTAVKAEREVPPPPERFRKMHQYGAQLRNKRMAMAAAARRSVVARRAFVRTQAAALLGVSLCSGSDAAAAGQEEGAAGMHRGEVEPERQAQAPDRQAEAGLASSEEQDGADEMGKHDMQSEAERGNAAGKQPSQVPPRACKRVALLPSKRAWAPQDQLRADISEMLMVRRHGAPSAAQKSATPDDDGGRERADEHSSAVATAREERLRRMQALRDAAQQLSSRISCLSYQRRQTREQDDISAPTRTLDDEDVASMNTALRQAGPQGAAHVCDDDADDSRAAAADAPETKMDSSAQDQDVTEEVMLDVSVEEGEGEGWCEGRQRSIDDSLKQVERQLADKRTERQRAFEAKEGTIEMGRQEQTVKALVEAAPEVRGLLPSRRHSLDPAAEAGAALAYDSHQRQEGGASGEKELEYESIEVQRSRISVLARRSGHAHVAGHDGGIERERDTRLFGLEEEEEGAGLEDIMRGMARALNDDDDDPFSLLNTLRREQSGGQARADPQQSNSSSANAQHVQGLDSRAYPRGVASGEGEEQMDKGRASDAFKGWGDREVDREAAARRHEPEAPTAADRLIARANELLPRDQGASRLARNTREDDWLEALESGAAGAAARGVSAALAQLSKDDLVRHERHLQQYLAHRDGLGQVDGPAVLEGGEDDICVVDLVFDPAWATAVVQPTERQGDDQGEEAAADRGPDMDRKAAGVLLDVADCLEVGISRLHMLHVSADEALMRVQVAAGVSAVRHGVIDTQPPHQVVAQLVAASLDKHSALRQRPSLALLSHCRVCVNRQAEKAGPAPAAHGHVDAPSAGLVMPLAATLPRAALVHGADWNATSSAGGGGRLTASELQQRLLAEVDYLDEMHNAEHHLVSMVQVQQVAAAQEEAVVLAQALLDRERVVAEDKEREARRAAQAGGANSEMAAVLREALKESTDAFMQALQVSMAAQRQHPSSEMLDEMRQQHAEQLRGVVDAFKDSLSLAAGAPALGGDGGGGGKAQRQTSPRRPSQLASPLQKAGAGRAGGAADKVGEGTKDSSTSGVESDYTADFEDINEQSIAEEEAAAAQDSIMVDEVPSPAASPAGKRSALSVSQHYDATQSIADDVDMESSAHLDASRDIVRGHHSIQSSHGRRGSSRGLSPAASVPSPQLHASERSSRPPSASLREDYLPADDDAPSAFDDDTIDDQVGDDMLSGTARDSIRDSIIQSTGRPGSRLSQSRQDTQQSQHYSEDFEEQYSDDFESRISQSADVSRLQSSSHGQARTSAHASGGAAGSWRAPTPKPSKASRTEADAGEKACAVPGEHDAASVDGMVDLKLMMPELPVAMQQDATTRNGLTVVEQSLKEAHVRAGQQAALLRLQEQALDERALAQLRRISDEHRVVQAAAGEDGRDGQQVREMQQRRLDDEERSTRMRLAADKADLQRQRAAARAELLRRQLELQEHAKAFLASRAETLTLKGILPPNTYHDLFQLQPQPQLAPAHSSAPPQAAGHGRGHDAERRYGASPQASQQEDDQRFEESYLSDALDSVASEVLDYLDEQRDAHADAEQEALHMQSVRDLANQLGSNVRDPTGRSLAAREKSAADKREYALMLLGEKEAAVGRRRRELHVEAEERRTNELLVKALSINVDEEARKEPPPDDADAVWDMQDAALPGTPASFVSPCRHDSAPAVAALATEQEEAEAPQTPRRHDAGGSQVRVEGEGGGGSRRGLAVVLDASSDEDQDDITPPRSVASVRSPDGQGLFVRTAFDPLSAAAATARSQGSLTSDVSDAVSDTSLDQDLTHPSQAVSSSIREVDLEEQGGPSASAASGADSIAEEAGLDSSYLQGDANQQHSEIEESIQDLGAAGRRGAPVEDEHRPAESVAYSVDFDKDGVDKAWDGGSGSGSVAEVIYSEDFEEATGGASLAPAQSVPSPASEAYSQDFEDASSVRTRARGSATVVDSSAAGYSYTFEAESPSQLYSNTFETESGAAGEAAAASRRRGAEEDQDDDIIEERPGEVSSSSSITLELALGHTDAASRSASPAASARAPAAARSAQRADGQEHAAAAGVSVGKEEDEEAYSDSFLGESASQSMLADAAQDARASASSSLHKAPGDKDDLDKTGAYSDSLVGIHSHEADSVAAPPAAAAAGGLAAAEGSVGGDSVATDMSSIEPDAQDEGGQAEQVQAAECLRQRVRAAMARKSMLAQLEACRRQQQQDEPQEAAQLPQAPPQERDRERLDERALVPDAFSPGAAHQSIAEESMTFSDTSAMDTSGTWRAGRPAASSPTQSERPQQASPGSSAPADAAAQSGSGAEEMAQHVALEVEKGEGGCPPVSSPPLSPARALDAVHKLQQDQRQVPPASRDRAPAALQAADAEAAAAAEEARVFRTSQMVLVSDALLAEVLEEMMTSLSITTPPTVPAKDSPTRPAAGDLGAGGEAAAATPRQAESPQPTTTPSPGKRSGSAPGSGRSSQGASPGALELMAPLESPASSPGPSTAAGRDDGQAPDEGVSRMQADDASVSSAQLAAAAASKSSAAAVAYASILLKSLGAACYSGGLDDMVFLDLARSKFSGVEQDQHIFHKLIFDVAKSEIDSRARASMARRPLHAASASAYGSPVPVQVTEGARSEVDRQVLEVVQRLAAAGDCTGDDGAVRGDVVPGSQLDLAALQALVDADLIRMEKEWVQYEEEEDVIKVAVADALLDDLLLELTADLVAAS